MTRKHSRPAQEEGKTRLSRRQFLGSAAKAAALGTVASAFPYRINILHGAETLRNVGLGVSIINEIQTQASKDIGHTVRGQALGYGAMFAKMLNQNNEYEIAEGYYNDMDVMWPAKVWQPIDTTRIKAWDKVTNLTKTGKLTPNSNEGQGDAPFRHLWVDKDGNRTQKGPQRHITMVPAFHNADSIGYNPKATGAKIESWAELFNPKFKGKIALLNVPQIGTMDAAMAIEALGLFKFKDKGNMTKKEIDFLVTYLIERKREGHFRAFWESFGQSVTLMTSGEVVLESMWSPAVTAIKAEGVPCVYASPKEGMRGWHGGLAISAKVTGRQLDAAYDYINWWIDGWPGAFVARQGYYTSAPDLARKHMSPEEWDYWYMGRPAAKELPDPFGTIIVPKGEIRDGGSYLQRFSNIAVWNSLMDENEYLVKRWNEFLSA
jgi:putative spermidine/putrescine transport system substrate-binding protein